MMNRLSPCGWTKQSLTEHFLADGWLHEGEFISYWELHGDHLTLHIEEGRADSERIAEAEMDRQDREQAQEEEDGTSDPMVG